MISSVLLAASIALSGCFDNGTPTLDNDDIRFAGFYSDYLLYSGVAPAGSQDTPVVLATSDIRVLLQRHNLDQERLARKIAAYRNSPELWQLVLRQIRLHIRQKEAAGE